MEVLRYARDSETISFIDSAIAYGNGVSNNLIAEVFDETSILSSRQILCSKIGRSRSDVGRLLSSPKEFVFDISRVIGSRTFRSIAVHDLDLFDPKLMEKVCRVIIEEKRCGRIETWGMSLAKPCLTPLLELCPDFVQCNFNILDDRLMSSGLYAWASSAGVNVWARTVFVGGSLTQTRSSLNGLMGERASKKLAVINQLIPILERSLNLPIQEIALRYVCSFDWVNPLIGATSISMLEENIRISDQGGFASSELELIRGVSAKFISQFDELLAEV
jgi:aryl-alcohol dehydrogenase-like predicted oxidoreductase